MSQSLPVPSMEPCAAVYSVFHCAGDKCSSGPNWGYDDSRGDYLTVVRPIFPPLRLCCCCAHCGAASTFMQRSINWVINQALWVTRTWEILMQTGRSNAAFRS